MGVEISSDLPDNPEVLLQLMRDSTHAMRFEAAIKLAKLASRDATLMRLIIAGIQDPDTVFRHSVYLSMRHIDPNQDAQVEDILLHSFRSSDNDESRIAAYALVKHLSYANPAVSRLLEDLSDTEPLVRRTAAGMLSEAPSQARRSIPRLVQVLADPDKDVRFAASRSLAILADDRVVPLFVDLAEDEATTPMIGWFIGFTIGRMPHLQSPANEWLESLRHRKQELAASISTGIADGLAGRNP